MPKRVLSLVILAVLLSACSTSGSTPAPAAETAPPEAPPTVPVEAATAALPPPPTAAPDLAALDPCTLLDPASLEAALGEATTPSPGPGVCVFVGASGTQSVTLATLTGDTAKALFLDTIAQLQDNCSVSFSMQGDATPTAFPPEIQAMSGLSLAELIEAQEQVQREQCGFAPAPDRYQRLEGLGDAAYFQVLNLGFVQSGIVVIVRGDSYLSVTYAAPTIDPATARSIGESLAAEALTRLP